jgi:hypothetical protein
LPAARGEPYPQGVAGAIALSIDTVTSADPAARTTPAVPATPAAGCRELLGIVSLLSPDGVPRRLLYLGQSADVFAASPEDLDELLARLTSASLLSFTGAPPVVPAGSTAAGSTAAEFTAAEFTAGELTVTAHRLVMRVARERAARDGTLTDLALKAVALLHAYGQSLDGSRWNRPAARDLIRQVEALTEVVASQPRGEVDGQLLNLRIETLHHILELRDNLPQAVEITEKLAAEVERTYGRSHPTTVTFLTILASFYLAMDRVSDAVPVLERVIPEQERTLGVSHPGTLRTRRTSAPRIWALAERPMRCPCWSGSRPTGSASLV